MAKGLQGEIRAMDWEARAGPEVPAGGAAQTPLGLGLATHWPPARGLLARVRAALAAWLHSVTLGRV